MDFETLDMIEKCFTYRTFGKIVSFVDVLNHLRNETAVRELLAVRRFDIEGSLSFLILENETRHIAERQGAC